VVVPLKVPLTSTVTPGMPKPSSSEITIPETLPFCAIAEKPYTSIAIIISVSFLIIINYLVLKKLNFGVS
jgi:hypothetical protein